MVDFCFETKYPPIQLSDETRNKIQRIIGRIIREREAASFSYLLGIPTHMMTNEQFFQKYFPWGVPKDHDKAKKMLDARMKELGEIE